MKKLILCCLLGTLVFSMVAGAVPAEAVENEEYTVFTPYEYPIEPGTAEWATLQTNVDKINACRVPDELIEKMSTDALLETYLTHPMATNIFAFNTYDDGVNTLKDGYYMGLDELLQREDLGDAILRSYNEIDVCTDKVPEGDAAVEEFLDVHEEEIDDMWRMSLLEVLAAEANVAAQNQSSRSRSLESAMEEKYSEKMENIELYGPFAATYYKTLDEKANINSIGNGETLVYLHTPRGNPVESYHISYDFDAATKEAYREEYAKCYPNAKLLRDATPKYNCHSYAWHSTSADNSYWVYDVEAYMRDGSYVLSSDLKANEKIFYSRSPDTENHSALVIKTNSATVRSKWGAAGLYEHNYGDCPYYVSYDLITFWKRNPNDI